MNPLGISFGRSRVGVMRVIEKRIGANTCCGGQMSDNNLQKVYRYLNDKGEVIYVGKTKRPLRNRVYEHKAEELWKETYKIEYIELPNTMIMNQYEMYYIGLWKPKYNTIGKAEGIPVALPEYPWILHYEKKQDVSLALYNLSIINDLYKCLNKHLFNNEINAHITYSSYPYSIDGICIDNTVRYGEDCKYKIDVPESLIIENSQNTIIWILTQMVLIYGEMHKMSMTSHNGRYKNKRFKNVALRKGLVIYRKNDQVGYVPKGVTKDVKVLTKER